MSDERRPEDLAEEAEDRAIQEVIDALERGDVPVSSAARPYLETLGALPYQLEPVLPSAALKESLMAAVAAADRGEPVVRSEPVVELRARAWRPSVAPPKARAPIWALRAAAVLALALLGVSGVQYGRLSTQGRQIERQSAEILRLKQELAEVLPAASRPPGWMAASGTELCALRPRQVEGKGAVGDQGSKGWLFVRQDHQHWFVTVEGLAPSPQGHVYELWFDVEGKLVSAGTFRPDGDGRAILTSESMPNPVTGIAITLEPDNGDGVPSEQMILWGDEVMLVL